MKFGDHETFKAVWEALWAGEFGFDHGPIVLGERMPTRRERAAKIGREIASNWGARIKTRGKVRSN